MGIQGYPVAAGVLTGLVAIRLWHYHKAPRITAWLFGIAAFCLTIGVTVWLDALAGLTGAGTGLTVLGAVLVIGGISWYFEAVRKHKHHRIWTPVVGIVFGSALVLGIALSGTLMHQGLQTGGKTSQALAQAVVQVHSGKAAAAVPASHRMSILIVGLAILVVLVFLAISYEKRSKGGGSPAGLPGRSGAPAARRGLGPSAPALPAGRGRRR